MIMTVNKQQKLSQPGVLSQVFSEPKNWVRGGPQAASAGLLRPNWQISNVKFKDSAPDSGQYQGGLNHRARDCRISDFGNAPGSLCTLCVHFSVLGHRVATVSFMFNGARQP